jgi:hypothetical protein
MDIDADHLTIHLDSTCPAAPSIPTDIDVDHSHTRRQDPPVCPADRPRAHLVRKMVDLTGDRPKVDITEITTTDERQVIHYVRSGPTRLGISCGSIDKMWNAWKTSLFFHRQSPPLSAWVDKCIDDTGCL